MILSQYIPFVVVLPRTAFFFFAISSSGVPGMVARLLGATAVLTEQDELLSLLDRNLAKNFPQDEGIRKMALDWERPADTDAILASLMAPKISPSSVGADVRGRCSSEEAIAELDDAGGGGGLNLSVDGGAQHVAAKARSDDAGEEEEEEGAVAGKSTHLEFILCAE